MRSLIGAILDTARPPVPYASKRWSTGLTSGLFGQRASKTEQLQATATNSTLYGVVDALCEKTAAVGWNLWVKAKSGKDEDRTLVEDTHPLAALWTKPNDFMVQRLFIEIVQQYLDLTGEGPIVVVKRAGIPAELWPVRPDRLRPVPDPVKFLAGFVYEAPDGEKVPLDVDQVIRLMKPDPDNIYRGLGPVQALMRKLDAAKYSEEWNAAFFSNGAQPGGIIEVEEDLSPADYRKFRERWAETHQGVNNAHRVAILENGMKWVERKFSAKDMQFAELDALGDEKILKAYRMSKFGIGQVDDVNRATAEASQYAITSDLIVPRLDRWSDALNFHLLPMYGASTQGLELDYADPIEPNQETQNATLTAQAGAVAALVPVGFDGNSAVKAFGLPDTLIWTKPEPPAPPVLPGGNGGNDSTTKSSNRSSDDEWRSMVAELTGGVPRFVAEADLAQVQREWRDELDQLQADWPAQHAAQLDDLERQITAAVDRRDPAALAALVVPSAILAAGTALLATAMTTLAGAAAATMAAEAGEQGVLVSAGVADVGELQTVASVTVALLGQSLAAGAGREAIRVYTGVSEGAAVARQVRALYEAVPAATDAQLGAALTRAQNCGRLATLLIAPFARYYASEKLDTNTCKPCRDIDGQELPTLDAAMLAYGGGPYLFCKGTVRCRGTFVARWDTPESDFAELARGWFGPKAWDPIEHPRDPGTGEFIDNPVPDAARAFMTSLNGVEALADTAQAVREADGGLGVPPEWHRLSGGASGAGVRMAVLSDGRKVIEKKAPDWGSDEPRQAADAEQLGSLLARTVAGADVAGAYRDEQGSVWLEHVSGATLGEHLYTDADGGFDLSDQHQTWLQTREAKIIGLADALMANPDRNDGNVIFTPDGAARGIDHAGAFERFGFESGGKPAPANYGNSSGMPVEHFVTPPKAVGKKMVSSWADNPLTAADVERLRGRLDGLRPDFDKLERGDWLDQSLAALAELAKHATGTEDLTS